MTLDVLLLGPQGSGKGTQAKRLAAQYGIPHVSTGDMFRSAIAAGTELGLQVQPILAAGALVPDELTVALIRERLSQPDAAEGFVLDGFPRNLAQAEALSGMLTAIGRSLSLVLELQLDDETCVDRMLGRAQDEGRADDTPEVIRRRLETYHGETEPLVEYYRAQGNTVHVDGSRSVEQVFAQIADAVEQVEARSR